MLLCDNDTEPPFVVVLSLFSKLCPIYSSIDSFPFPTVMFTPLLRVVPSPNTKLDLAFIISFSFNPLSVFPYPTEKPPLPMLPLNPFLDSSYEYEL